MKNPQHYPHHRLHGFAAEPFFKIYQKPTKKHGKLKMFTGGFRIPSIIIQHGSNRKHNDWNLEIPLKHRQENPDSQKICRTISDVSDCGNDQIAKFLNISPVVENVNPVIKQGMHKGWIFNIQYWLLAMKADKYSNIFNAQKHQSNICIYIKVLK